MVYHPAQAPNPNSDPWSRNAAQPIAAYPSIPSHNMAPQSPQYSAYAQYPQATFGPTHQQSQEFNNQAESDRKGRRNLYLTIGGGVAALLATGALVFGSKVGESEGQISNQNQEGTSASLDTWSQDPALMSSYQFNNIPREQQLDFAGTILNENPQQVAEDYREYLKSEGWTRTFTADDGVTTRTIAEPNKFNSPQEILDQIAVGYFQVWQTAHDGNVELARKLAAGLTDVGSPEHTELLTAIDNVATGAKPFSNAGYAESAKDTIESGAYHNVDAEGMPLIEFTRRSAFKDNDRTYFVARFEHGSSEDSGRWILHRSIKTR